MVDSRNKILAEIGQSEYRDTLLDRLSRRPTSKGLSSKHGASMAQDRVNIVDALRGQQEQLKRLIAQKIWISDAPKATLSEIDAQLSELKRLLAQLQSEVQDQLKKGKYDLGPVETDPMRQRSPEDVSKALDLAGQQIDN